MKSIVRFESKNYRYQTLKKLMALPLFIFTLVLASLLPCIAAAEVMYVDDTLLVPLRSGEGTSFRIIHKGLKSGTMLEILEQNQESGYSKVKTPNGQEGFLPTRYLTSTPIAKIKLVNAQKLLTGLSKENSELKDKLSTLSKEHTLLSNSFSKKSEQLNKNTDELTNIKSISANALNLDKRNRELRESNEQLRSELELLQTENMRLKDNSDSNMLLIGGGLIILGALLALIIPTIKPSKKNDNWA